MKHNETRQGYALLTVLFIMTALALSLGMLVHIGQQRSFDARRLTNQTKALAYAEAGIDYAYAILSADFEQRNNPSAFSLEGGTEGSGFLSAKLSSIESGYGEGAFDLTLTSISNRYVVVNSVGQCGKETAMAEVLVEDIYAGSGGYEAPNYADMEGFNYAVLSGGVFDFKGCGEVLGSPDAKLHSNSAIEINGSAQMEVNVSSSVEISVGNTVVNGSVTAPELDIHKKATITDGAATASVPPVSIPDIDLTPYFNWAKKHGEVYNGFSTTTSYSPNGGILYVIGDVVISDHAVFNGSIIATGSIKISGAAQIKPTIDSIAMATDSGNIENTSSGRITGLVYSKSGSYKQTANGELYGQLIVGGPIQKGGVSDIIVYQQSIPTPPGISSVSPTKSLPLISAWQK